jgi:hypothetical protein
MSQPMNPYDDQAARPAGMSGTAKLFIGLGIGCGVVLLLCCGGFVAVSYWGYNLAKNAQSTDPAVIRRVTDEIVSIDIPPSFTPEMSLDMQIPFNEGKMQMVQYRDKAAKAFLMLIQFSSDAIAENPAFKTQMQTAMNRPKSGPMQTEKSQTVEVTINGEPAKFTIVQGKRGGQDALEVTGAFRGKGGPAQLVLELQGPELAEEQAVAIVKSMK